MRSRLVRRVAAAALVALVVAAALAAADARTEGWPLPAWWRLVVERFWDHADRWLPALGAAAVLLTLLERLVRRAPLPPRHAALALALCLGVAAARLLDLAGVPRPPARPNLLLVSVDTLRADRLGTYGNALPTSPRLDALAAEGVLFETVLSQSPKTTPSHATMLTSLAPCVHGLTMWEGTEARPVLSPRVHTLAEALRARGYATAAFTGGGPMDRSRGFGQGFARYREEQPIERAMRWLAKRPRGRPFFLFVHTFEVHDPYVPRADLVEQFLPGYRGPLLDVVADLRRRRGDWDRAHRRFWDAADLRDPATRQALARLYEAGIRSFDDGGLTRLLAEVDRLGLAGDTLVVVTGDHGEAFGEHGRFLHDDLHIGTLHVPLVLRLPGRLPAGVRVAEPARLLDVVPTVLDLLAVAPLPDMQGRSLAPFARGGAGDGTPPPAVSEWTDPHGPPQIAVRSGGFSYLEIGGVPALFDLHADPGEQHDLAANQSERVATFHSVVDAWRADCARLTRRYGPQGPGVAPSDEVLRRLRALGYVE